MGQYKRDLDACQLIERSIQKKYRKVLWTPFVAAVKRYRLILPGDRIAVCVSGGRDSMLLAKLMQLLRRYSDVPFDMIFLAVDPGFIPEKRLVIEQNVALLNVPLQFFEAEGGSVPRGLLYDRARALGCGKIALGNHFNDVIETAVASMLYGAQIQGMMPKARSARFPDMELIRPLYCVHEDDIIAWGNYNSLEFPESADGRDGGRREAGALLKQLKRDNPDIEKSVFNSVHAVNLDTFPGWKSLGEAHSFLDGYDEKKPPSRIG